jgi:hypothetical protein
VRRILLFVTVAAMLTAMLTFASLAFAQPTEENPPNCISSALANENSGFGTSSPGVAGSGNREGAEQNQMLFGQSRSGSAQADNPCGFAGEPGPPGAFDPTATP